MTLFLATLIAFAIVIALLSLAHTARRASGCSGECAGCAFKENDRDE